MELNSKIQIREILYHLNTDPRLIDSGSTIFVNVIDGRVILTGNVPTICIRDLAEDIAFRVPHLISIENYLKVTEIFNHKPGADHELKTKVLLAIQLNHQVAPHTITVNAIQGKIILKGSVTLAWKRELAENIAYSISNVKEVVNNISIAE